MSEADGNEDGGVVSDLWNAGSDLLDAAGEAAQGVYHAGVAGAELLMGDSDGAANQWDQAGEHAHNAVDDVQDAGDNVQNAWDDSGIDPEQLID